LKGVPFRRLALLTACREVGVFYKRWVAKSSETTTLETPKKSLRHLRNQPFPANCRGAEIAGKPRSCLLTESAILAYFTRIIRQEV